jgi:ornithine carbamoyltransferase
MVSRPRDLLALDDLSGEELTGLLAAAVRLGRAWPSVPAPLLVGRRVALVRDDGGWRNTAALDLGATRLGATVTHVPATLSGRETVADLAGYLDGWFELIAIRAPSLADLRDLADAAVAPVVNLRTRTNHPCETLGDIASVVAGRGLGALDGLRVVVIAPDANILGSWVEATASLPITVTQVYPEGWHVPGPWPERFDATGDLDAVTDADVLVTDCWPPDGDPVALAPYRVTPETLGRLAPGGRFIPCPPVTRGEEVSAEAMTHPACAVPGAKRWLLHAQDAVLCRALGVTVPG